MSIKMCDTINYDNWMGNGIDIYNSDSDDIQRIKSRVSYDFFMCEKLDLKYFTANIDKIKLTEQQISHELYHRANRGDMESIEWMINHFNMVEKPYLMNSALSGAAYNGNLQLVKYFIAKGADPHYRNEYTFSCAMTCDRKTNGLPVAKYLYYEIGDIDIYANNMKVFKWCIFNGTAYLTWLVELDRANRNCFNPNVKLRDDDDDSAENIFAIAALNGLLDMCKLLLTLGANYKHNEDSAYRISAKYTHSYNICDWLMTIDSRYSRDYATGEYLITANGVETFRCKEIEYRRPVIKNSIAEEQAKQNLIKILEEAEQVSDKKHKARITRIRSNVSGGMYSDFASPHTMPTLALTEDLKSVELDFLVDRVYKGEFDHAV